MAGNDATADRARVAVVGTGLAGLTTAYLLHNDPKKQYEVTLFERAPCLAFDAASVAVKDETTGVVERIDLPMRAAAGGYYANLMRMYEHLGIRLHPVRFLFAFAKALQSSATACSSEDDGAEQAGAAAPCTYFIHASNLHQTPPPWPANRPFLAHVVEILYLVVCHFWFSVACFVVQPRSSHATVTQYGQVSGESNGETLSEYLERIRLPRRYISHYLLPLMSSVSTCSHNEVLAFPASDIVNYKRLSNGQQHYTVCGGVRQVQASLINGITDIRLNAQVLAIDGESTGGGVVVRWASASDATGGEAAEETFDRVVLAVSPDVASRIFNPLRTILSHVPTVQTESSVLNPRNGAYTVVDDVTLDGAAVCSHHSGSASPPQYITFRTCFSEPSPRTEALHKMPSGVVVTTCPLEPAAESKQTLQTARFTRTVRTVQSRSVVQQIMNAADKGDKGGKRDEETRQPVPWVNGQDNVWLTGAWCWDGMVLLEGCVSSAMQVADDFGVGIPWRRDG